MADVSPDRASYPALPSTPYDDTTQEIAEASAARDHDMPNAVYPAQAFQDPQLTAPTPITVAEDGRVFGHLALFSGHQARDGQPFVPRSSTGYDRYHRLPVTTDAGPLQAGSIVIDIPSAPRHLGIEAAIEHYDMNGELVAFVRAGEDEHGIWLAGHLWGDLTLKEVGDLREHQVCGDWRKDGDHLELIGTVLPDPDLEQVPGPPVPQEGWRTPPTLRPDLLAQGLVPVYDVTGVVPGLYRDLVTGTLHVSDELGDPTPDPTQRLCEHVYTAARKLADAGTSWPAIDAPNYANLAHAWASDYAGLQGQVRGLLLGICAVEGMDDVEAGAGGRALRLVEEWAQRNAPGTLLDASKLMDGPNAT